MTAFAATVTAMDATAEATETARTGTAAVAGMVATKVGVVIGEIGGSGHSCGEGGGNGRLDITELLASLEVSHGLETNVSNTKCLCVTLGIVLLLFVKLSQIFLF